MLVIVLHLLAIVDLSVALSDLSQQSSFFLAHFALFLFFFFKYSYSFYVAQYAEGKKTEM